MSYGDRLASGAASAKFPASNKDTDSRKWKDAFKDFDLKKFTGKKEK